MKIGCFLVSLDYFPAYGVDKLGITDNIVKIYYTATVTQLLDLESLSVGLREMEECTESL